MRRIALALAVLFAPLALPAVTGAQEARQQVVNPEPIAADAPTAKVALGLAHLMLAGDRAMVDAYLQEHAAASVAGSAELAAAITEAMDALKTGPRVVVGQDGFAGERAVGVGVQLAEQAGGEVTRGIIVRMDAAAPHRITAVRVAAIRIG